MEARSDCLKRTNCNTQEVHRVPVAAIFTSEAANRVWGVSIGI